MKKEERKRRSPEERKRSQSASNESVISTASSNSPNNPKNRQKKEKEKEEGGGELSIAGISVRKGVPSKFDKSPYVKNAKAHGLPGGIDKPTGAVGGGGIAGVGIAGSGVRLARHNNRSVSSNARKLQLREEYTKGAVDQNKKRVLELLHKHSRKNTVKV